MEHIAALLLIVGCSDDLSTCKELPAPVPVFETAQECETTLPSGFRLYTGQYPQLFAQCVAVDPEDEETDADLVWNIKPDGTMVAAIEQPQVQVAGNESGDADVATTRDGRGSRVTAQ